MNNKIVAVCCVVKNSNLGVERRLIELGRRILECTGSFPANYFVVESDSDRRIEFSSLRKMTNLSYHYLGELQAQLPDRIPRLAACRNVYMDSLREHDLEPDFLVVVDPDAGNYSSLNFATAFEELEDFDAVFANWRPLYYDILALRSDSWVTSDYRSDPSDSKFHTSRIVSWLRAVNAVRRIDPRQAAIPVKSAFGGLAVYKYDSVKSSRYIPKRLAYGWECEHVSFNASIDKLAVLPNFMISGVNRHILWFVLAKPIAELVRRLGRQRIF